MIFRCGERQRRLLNRRATTLTFAATAYNLVPPILEDVGHLQPLAEGDGQREQLVATFVDLGRVITEQLGEHLADHAGDMVAIAIQVGQVVQAGGGRVPLKLRHALRHDPHAAFERAALGSTKPVCDADDPGGVRNQIMLAGGRRRRQR